MTSSEKPREFNPDEFRGQLTRAQELWKRQCPDLDSVLAEYVEKLGGSVEAWLEDTPSRVLGWRDNRADYSVSMLLAGDEGQRLKVWGAAWRDDETDETHPTRRVLQLAQQPIDTPVSSDQFRPRLNDLVTQLVRFQSKFRWV